MDHYGGLLYMNTSKRMRVMLQRVQAFRSRAKSKQGAIIRRAQAARYFRVPINTIQNLWPRLPFCTTAVIHRKSADSTKPSDGPTAVQANFDPADLLTIEQLAKRLQVSTGWIREKTRRRNRNKLPSFSLGRYVRFHWPDVCRWMMESQS